MKKIILSAAVIFSIGSICLTSCEPSKQMPDPSTGSATDTLSSMKTDTSMQNKIDTGAVKDTMSRP